MNRNLLKEIDAYKLRAELSDSRIGVKLANNGRLLERLRKGGRVWPETAEKIFRRLDELNQRLADGAP